MTATLQEPGTGSGDLADAVALTPADSARNVIQGANADVIALIIRAVAGQSLPILVVQTEDGQDAFFVYQPGSDPDEVIAQLRSNDSKSKFAWDVNGGAFPEAVFWGGVDGGGGFRRFIEFDTYFDSATPENSYTKLRLTAQPGQIQPILDMRDAFDVPTAGIGADGHIELVAPDSGRWKLLVANDGTLSTVAA